jgi:hypothetical protein
VRGGREGKGKRNGARLPLLQQAVKLTKGCLYRWVMKRFGVQENTRGAKVIGSRAIRSRTVFSKRQIEHGQQVRMAAATMNRWRPSVNTTVTVVTRTPICDGSS